MPTEKKENKLEHYIDLYEQARKKVGDSSIAIALVQEIAKDSRMEQIRAEKAALEDKPATSKQIAYLKSLGVVIPENLTKHQASTMIEDVLAKESE